MLPKSGFGEKEKLLNRCYTAFRRLFFVVPPGNIIKRVTYCVIASLMFSLIQCSRIAHGYNSPFFTTLYMLLSSLTKVINFLDFRA